MTLMMLIRPVGLADVVVAGLVLLPTLWAARRRAAPGLAALMDAAPRPR